MRGSGRTEGVRGGNGAAACRSRSRASGVGSLHRRAVDYARESAPAPGRLLRGRGSAPAAVGVRSHVLGTHPGGAAPAAR